MVELEVGARQDLDAAAGWYEDQCAGLGDRFLLELLAAFAVIEQLPRWGSPWTHPLVPKDVRRVFLRTFSYAVVYVTEPRLVVVAIAHGHRSPGYWVERLAGV